jgi:hypothetical protein
MANLYDLHKDVGIGWLAVALIETVTCAEHVAAVSARKTRAVNVGLSSTRSETKLSASSTF